MKKQLDNYLGKDFKDTLKHSLNYLTGDFLSKGIVFLTLPLFTRLMTPDDFGILSVYNSIVGILAIIYGFGIRGALVRYYYENRGDFQSFVGAIGILLMIVIGSVTTLLLLFQNYLVDVLSIPKNLLLIAIGGSILVSIIEVYKAYLQASKQSKSYSLLNVINTIGFVAFAIAFMLLLSQEKYYSYAWAKVIIGTIIGIYSMIHLMKLGSWNFSKGHLRYILLFSIPIIFHLLSQNILSSFDQIIINKIEGAWQTGLYSVGYKVGMIQSIVITSFLGAWTPMFYKKMNAELYTDIYSIAKRYASIIAIVGSVLIVFSKEIVLIFADSVYQESFKIVPYIVFGYFFTFLYSMYATYLLYNKRNVFLAIFTIVAGVFNIMLNVIFIPRFGYVAAAWTTTFSYFLLFALHYCNVKFILKYENLIPMITFLKPLVVMLLSFITTFLIVLCEDAMISFSLRLVALLLINLVLFKNVIFNVFRIKRS